MSDSAQIDEGLYSRQIYALGLSAMKRMANASILIYGAGGLGTEIAKNIVLAGVKSVTISDPNNVVLGDLASNFYLNEEMVGQNRAISILPMVKQLNEYVSVAALTNEISTKLISNFSCVIITIPIPYSQAIEISDFCHKNQIKFILTQTRGLFAFTFNDFGDKFTVTEPNSENPTKFLIASITNEENGVVTVEGGERHNLSDSDHVRFSNIEGMTELNGCEFPIKVIDSKRFSITDTRSFGKYSTEGNRLGYGEQVFMPIDLSFVPLSEAIKHITVTDFDLEPNLDAQVVLLFLSSMLQLETGRSLTECITDLNSICNLPPISATLISEFERESGIEISPMCSAFGGISAQESLKSVSGRFIPINGFISTAYLTSLPSSSITYTPQNDRYDPYRKLFGNDQQTVIQNLVYFMVGAGAIGCEMLKCWALMGVASSDSGKVYVTDMDTIEKSNLNRQFLFRNSDIGKSKSVAACKAAQQMNPDFHLVSQINRLGDETNDVYTEDFFTSLSGICNALDNVPTRIFTNSKCLLFGLPLLESGTLGPMASFQMIVPKMTESYSDLSDPKMDLIPICTLHSHPTTAVHCVAWAKEEFEPLFHGKLATVNAYINDKGFVKKNMKNPDELVNTLKTAKELLDRSIVTFDDCIREARLLFEEFFNWRIRQLMIDHPIDEVESTGQRYWNTSRRVPVPLKYDSTDHYHADFVNAAAAMIARVNHITPESGAAEKAQNIEVPEFTVANHKSDKIPTDHRKYLMYVKRLVEEASPIRQKQPFIAEEFEKDDDGHVDFVSAASNLRAINYGIPPESKIEVKRIAGNIMPALATTTAMVCGFVCLEMYKMHSVVKKEISDFRGGFINLACASFTMTQPMPCFGEECAADHKLYTDWDSWILDGDLTIGEVVEKLRELYGFKATMITVCSKLAYMDMITPAEGKNVKISEVFKDWCGFTLPPGNHLIKIEAEALPEKISHPTIYVRIP